MVYYVNASDLKGTDPTDLTLKVSVTFQWKPPGHGSVYFFKQRRQSIPLFSEMRRFGTLLFPSGSSSRQNRAVFPSASSRKAGRKSNALGNRKRQHP